MSINTAVSGEWQWVLSYLTPAEQELLVSEAERLASAIKYRNSYVRISTNGALEVLFAIGCAENRLGKGNQE